MKDPGIYAIKVWLGSAVVSPFLSIFVYGITNSDAAMVIPLMILIGSVCSLPSAFCLTLACKYIVDRGVPVTSNKLRLSLVGILLSFIPFWVLGDLKLDTRNFTLAAPYCLTIVLGIWIHRIDLLNDDSKMDADLIH